MKQIVILLFHSSLFIGCAMAQPLMRDVFAAMPDSVLPMVTKNNRLDCIDFIENNMEAKVRNVADEYVTLEALTKDYARFRTSTAAVMEMKLLPVDTLTSHLSPFASHLLCLVTTAQTGEPNTPRRLEDSNIRFLRPDWMPLDSIYTGQVLFSMPPVSVFLTHGNVATIGISDSPGNAVSPESSDKSSFDQALRSLEDFHPVRLALSPDTTTLTATLQPAYLAVEERKAVATRLRPLTFRWNGSTFVVSAHE